MELTSLLSKINHSKASKPPEQFLALNINSDSVQAAVWEIEASAQPRIISTGSVEDWSKSPDNTSLITAADNTLSTALETIDQEPNKVIFGLPDNWVDGQKISASKMPLIKDLSEKLSLKPIGFVVSIEALVNFLKTKEGTPLTAIVVELTETDAQVSLVNVGKIVGTHQVGRSNDLGADVEEGLARFKDQDNLPARIIVTGSNLDLETARDELVSYAWQDRLPFLHLPKVEILSKDIPLRATVIAAKTPVSTTKHQAPQDQNLESHGFYTDKDVLAEQKPQPQPQTSPPPLPENNPQPSFNFKKIFSRIHFPKKLSLLIPIGAFILILVGLILAYIFLPKAQVTIYMTPKNLNEEIDFNVTRGKSTDIDKNRLGGELVEVEVSGEKSQDTSGEALVGEKAQGEVDIFNKTSSAKKFAASTNLVASNDLIFTLNEAITVASQSATDTGITFGKSTVKVTARSVGTSSNLPSDTSLTIKGFATSSYSAKVSQSFTDGSSKQVLSVSKSDRDDLLESLTTTLQDQALQELDTQVTASETLVSSGLAIEEISKQYSAAVDEEASSVQLKLKLRFSTLKFLSADALLLVQSAVSDQAPQGYTSLEAATQITISSAKVIDDDTVQVSADIVTKLVPQLKLAEITRYLAGKKPQATESFLKSIPNFSRVEIRLTPKLPQFLATFPRRADNITLTIEAEDE